MMELKPQPQPENITTVYEDMADIHAVHSEASPGAQIALTVVINDARQKFTAHKLPEGTDHWHNVIREGGNAARTGGIFIVIAAFHRYTSQTPPQDN